MAVLGKLKKKGMKRKTRFGAGVIGLLVLLLSAGAATFALNATKGLPLQSHTYAKAAFSRTGDLHVDDDVREASVRIGRISDITLENQTGVVTMALDDTRPVYKNASVKIVSRSGLGQKFVNIDRGDPSAGLLGPTDAIPTSQTEDSVELLDLADIFTPQATAGAQSALQDLGSGLEGHTQDLRDAFDGVSYNLPKLATVARALNSNNGNDVNTLLSSLDGLSARFEGRQQQLTDLNRQLATTFDAVDVNRGRSLQSVLEVAPPSFRDVRKALVDLQQPLETTNAAVTNLRPAVNSLVAATPDTRAVLREAPTPLAKVPGVSQVGQPAVASLTPVFANLQPLAPKVTYAVNTATVPVNYLSPNANAIATWFTRATNVLQQGDANGNWARFDAIGSCGVVGGVFLPVPGNDCNNPGTASRPATAAAGGQSNLSNSIVPSSATSSLPLIGGGR